MKKLEITEEKRIMIYAMVKNMTPNSDIYFEDHVRPVARNCFIYGKYLSKRDNKIDPIVCELSGLLHDIGYTKRYESDEKDHIIRGIRIAPDILKEIGIDDYYMERIVDAIWTHDGNLNRSKYKKIPLENYILNDVDAMQFFDWPLPSLTEFACRLKPNKKEENIIKGILEHTKLTFNYIEMRYFKNLAKPKYESRIEELEKESRMNNLENIFKKFDYGHKRKGNRKIS
ncbi:MAG: HD domain-containing protein [Nanoarchaeota archaeon]